MFCFIVLHSKLGIKGSHFELGITTYEHAQYDSRTDQSDQSHPCCNVIPRCRDNEHREDSGNKVAHSRHKMAGYEDEKICELRGEEVSWGANSNLQPGVIKLYRGRLGRYHFEVRKTTGAPVSAKVCQL